MPTTTDYAETHPAACETGVVCRVCKEEVVRITYTPSGDFGACACPWTIWCFERSRYTSDPRPGMGRVLRSTPLGYETKPKKAKKT